MTNNESQMSVSSTGVLQRWANIKIKNGCSTNQLGMKKDLVGRRPEPGSSYKDALK